MRVDILQSKEYMGLQPATYRGLDHQHVLVCANDLKPTVLNETPRVCLSKSTERAMVHDGERQRRERVHDEESASALPSNSHVLNPGCIMFNLNPRNCHEIDPIHGSQDETS